MESVQVRRGWTIYSGRWPWEEGECEVKGVKDVDEDARVEESSVRHLRKEQGREGR